MLVVIVILWILLFALLPRFKWYISKSRDVKRQADLRTIATAIDMYRSDHRWEFPLRSGHPTEARYFDYYFWSATKLDVLVPKYLKSIPTDPSKKTMIKIHNWPLMSEKDGVWASNHIYWRWENWKWGQALKPWDYLYQIFRKNNNPDWWAAVLVAKVETPAAANFVFNKNLWDYWKHNIWWPWRVTPDLGWNFYKGSHMDIEQLYLCTSVEKGDEIITAKEWNSDCVYTSEEQLYYILKIE